MEDTYMDELCNKFTGFMVVKSIDLIHHLMDRYRKIIEMYLKENQRIFDETLGTTIPISKYFESIDDCIQYADGGNHPYKDS